MNDNSRFDDHGQQLVPRDRVTLSFTTGAALVEIAEARIARGRATVKMIIIIGKQYDKLLFKCAQR